MKPQFLLLLVLFFSRIISVQADNCIWTGAVNSNWSEAGNWSCGHVPGATDDIRIESGEITVPAGYDAVGKTLDVALAAQLLVALTGTLFIQN